jgi:predicted Abi (CAAX) family protease
MPLRNCNPDAVKGRASARAATLLFSRGEAVASRVASGKLLSLLKTPVNSELLQTLRTLRRRLVAQMFVARLVRWSFVAAGVILCAAALNRLGFRSSAAERLVGRGCGSVGVAFRNMRGVAASAAPGAGCGTHRSPRSDA